MLISSRGGNIKIDCRLLHLIILPALYERAAKLEKAILAIYFVPNLDCKFMKCKGLR